MRTFVVFKTGDRVTLHSSKGATLCHVAAHSVQQALYVAGVERWHTGGCTPGIMEMQRVERGWLNWGGSITRNPLYRIGERII